MALFGNREEKAAKEAEAQAELDRLNALSQPDLAGEHALADGSVAQKLAG